MLAADDEVLTLSKDDQLAHYEGIIEEGLQTFVDVGNALLAIKDGKLYQRKGFKTFEQYCEQKWEIGRSQAYRLMDGAEVVRNLSPVGDTAPVLPATESQARPLSRLRSDPETQRQAWQEAVETAPNGQVTQAHVEKVVEKFSPALAAKHAVHYSSDTPEHYTPPDIIERVLQCLGTIDLDPCSNSKEFPNVPAGRHFTIDDDGLSQWWTGNVYMNPPYGTEIGQWVDKLCAEYDGGQVTAAIALVPARTDTEWFRQLTEGGPFICFVHGRLRFGGPQGLAEGQAPFPSAVVYFGEHGLRFYRAFSTLGRIFQEVTVST